MLGIVRLIPRTKPVALILAAVLTVSSAVPLVSADLRPDYQPAAYAIQGARIVAVAGDPIEPGTVVVRDGVIEAVGRGGQGRGPLRRRGDRRQGPGRLPRLHRPVHDARARPPSAVTSLTGPGRAVTLRRLRPAPDPARQPQRPDARVRGRPVAGAPRRGWPRSAGSSASPTSWPPPAGRSPPARAPWSARAACPAARRSSRSPVALHINLRSPSGSPFGEGTRDDESDRRHHRRAPGPTRPRHSDRPDDARPLGRRCGGSVGYPPR